MRILIIEDEAIAAERLEALIQKVEPLMEVVMKLGSVKSTVKWLKENSVDLIFMDIHLSDGNSFQIFDQINISAPVIFITAYDQYALKAFKVNSIDYLLKPIAEEDLSVAIKKFKGIKNNTADLQPLLEWMHQQKPAYQKRFMVSTGKKIIKLDANEVAYFFITDKVVILQSKEQYLKFSIDYTLDNLEEILDPDDFFRINRKIIVSIHSITSMSSYGRGRIFLELKPKPEFETIVSIDRSAAFKNWLNG
ncbi:MAG: response regulator transcription factor [Chitinophagales bacterium]|nr:response regulator transcription factor [Chitinophagales bacterium]